MLRAKKHAPTLCSSALSRLNSHLNPLRNLGAHHNKGDKHMNRNTGMWTNNLEIELWVEVPGVKVLALNNNWTLPLTMYRKPHLLWIHFINTKGWKMKSKVLP
jgi:hypothetical protein